MNLPQHILIFGVRLYRWTLSPAKTFLFGPLGRCRFTPTCSEYALEALRHHGAEPDLASGAVAPPRHVGLISPVDLPVDLPVLVRRIVRPGAQSAAPKLA